jgi:nucleotide-binding universal stress UspA family protein
MKTSEAEIRVLHVVDPYPMKLAETKGTPELPDLDAARAEQREQAKRLLEKAASTLRSAGFQATWIVQEGDPRTAILDDADAWNADLIVMGSHGRSGLQRWLMGSVSEAIARHAACSVEIVRIRAPQ